MSGTKLHSAFLPGVLSGQVSYRARTSCQVTHYADWDNLARTNHLPSGTKDRAYDYCRGPRPVSQSSSRTGDALSSYGHSATQTDGTGWVGDFESTPTTPVTWLPQYRGALLAQTVTVLRW